MRSNFQGDGLKAFLLRGFLGSGALKIIFVLLNMGIMILLARYLGPEGYGTYAFAYALVMILSIPVQAGLPALVVREIARYRLKKEWGNLKGLLYRSNIIVFVLSLLMLASAGVYFWVQEASTDASQIVTILLGLLLIPFVALGSVRSAALRGFDKVVQGQVPEMVILPMILLLLIGLTTWFYHITPMLAMGLHVLAAVLAFAIGAYLLLRSIPDEVRSASLEYEMKQWVKSLVPLSLLAGMQIINTQVSIVLLGTLSSSSDVGFYRVAVQWANVIGLSVVIVNTVIAPKISRFYHAGETDRLQFMVTWSGRAIMLVALPLLAVFIVFGENLLRTVVGDEFAAANSALLILCVGQLISAMMGSVIMLLNMTGHEDVAVKGVMIAAIMNVILNVLLIPDYGIEGAAVATAVSLSVWNIFLWWKVKKKISINCFAFVGVKK